MATETDDCLIWPHASKNGYAWARLGDRQEYAHRAALIRFAGPPPTPKHEACHLPGIGCVKLCVNPRHLRWGTRFDNMQDAKVEHTIPTGERHYRHKLTAIQVAEIRNSSIKQCTLARMYGVGQSHISRLRSGSRRLWVES